MRVFAVPALLLSAVPVTARAGYELLAEFQRPGTQPLAPLTARADGNWYTTASRGGAANQGAVLRISPQGAVTTIHSFTGADGAAPVTGLCLAEDGSLFGSTSSGGLGYGTLYRITPDGVFTSLLSFTGAAGSAKGSVPNQLVLHTDGSFYGTTQAGGAAGWGTAFRLTAEGALTTLMEFSGTSGTNRGASPVGALTVAGNSLYGVTHEGGTAGLGEIFSLTTSGTFAVLAEFTGGSGARPGAHPSGGLHLNTDGALYGTTEFGGANDFGTAFKFVPGGSFTSLRAFADATGSQPAGALVSGADGLLYGSTAAGGSSGFGTLFKLTTTGVHTVLASFTATGGSTPGAAPRAGVAKGDDGNFYAATSAGGPGNAGVICRVSSVGEFSVLANLSLPLGWNPSGAPVADGADYLFPMYSGGSNGGGTLVRLASSGTVNVAAALGGTIGVNPAGALIKSGDDFYGVAARGGVSDRGSVFKFLNGAATVLSPGSTSGGSLPEGPLIAGNDGALYGTAREGGASSRGSLYKVSTSGGRTRLVSFAGTSTAPKGNRPRGGLALAPNTSYYGLSENGGTADAGTIFRMSAAGTLTTLAEFTTTGPRLPLGGLTLAADGYLYGTTSRGGPSDGGALIRVVPGTNTWSVLAGFTPATGTEPAGAVYTVAGVLYGLAGAGGTAGQGTVWRYTAGAGLEALFSFTGSSGAAPGIPVMSDGINSVAGGVVEAPDGVLFGVVPAGGSGGGGTAFRFTPSPIQEWKRANLGDPDAPDLGDPDGDGIPTLVEYALLMAPAQIDSWLVPVGSVSPAQTLQISVPRDPARSDVTIVVEASASLAGPWLPLAASTGGAPFSGPGYVSGDSAIAGLKNVIIRDTERVAAQPRRFLRVRVTR